MGLLFVKKPQIGIGDERVNGKLRNIAEMQYASPLFFGNESFLQNTAKRVYLLHLLFVCIKMIQTLQAAGAFAQFTAERLARFYVLILF